MYDTNEAARAMLKALVRAFRDPKRQSLKSEGIDERDLAFEADLIIPMDMEMPRYAQIKRGAIKRALDQMRSQGLIEFKDYRPGTLYRIIPTALGEQMGERLSRPWYRRLRDRLARRTS